MKREEQGSLTFTEMFDLPVTVDMRTAARALGICSATAYRLLRLGTFPCSVIQVGNKYRIATAELMRVLGIEDRPMYSVDPDVTADYPQSCITV